MSDTEPDRPSRWTEFIAACVAVVILTIFGTVVVWALVRANDAPMLADPAPETNDTLVCVSRNDASQVAAVRVSKKTPTVVTCPKGTRLRTLPVADQAPQARGAYDPNERTIGILAIVAPFVTTIVAFYYGARAGAGEGKAAAARAKTREMDVAKNLALHDRSFYDRLKKQGIIR